MWTTQCAAIVQQSKQNVKTRKEWERNNAENIIMSLYKAMSHPLLEYVKDCEAFWDLLMKTKLCYYIVVEFWSAHLINDIAKEQGGSETGNKNG